METITKAVGVVTLSILIIIFCACLMAVPLWALWNWVGVDILGLKHITVLQAWGIGFLASILFKTTSTK